MANDPSFAPPVSELATASIAPPGVVIDPAGGRGFSLDERASVPVTAQGGTWRMEYVTASVDLPSTAAQGSMAGVTVSIPGLVVGDLCFLGSRTAVAGAGSFILWTDPPVCSTAGQIIVDGFNADDSINDPAAMTLHFLVIHRFL